MESMFGDSSFNKDISSWNVINVNYMNRIFNGCTSLTKPNAEAIWNSWNVQLNSVPKNQLKNSLSGLHIHNLNLN